MIDIDGLSPIHLLALHTRVAERLRECGVVRSSNNPTGDLAEHLFCRAFDWDRTGRSHPAADAISKDGAARFQIKGRRWTKYNKSRQLGALRGLPDCGFDFLAGVLLREDYSVERAAIVPHALVLANATPVEYTNSWKFMLRDVVWTWPGVEDVTNRLRSVVL
ncbi:MAG TPA: hypothetical protein VGK90_03865 [Rhizomicrobium sp.]|jgi:hypothetical protein